MTRRRKVERGNVWPRSKLTTHPDGALSSPAVNTSFDGSLARRRRPAPDHQARLQALTALVVGALV
jgi:hypothetical protein